MAVKLEIEPKRPKVISFNVYTTFFSKKKSKKSAKKAVKVLTRKVVTDIFIFTVARERGGRCLTSKREGKIDKRFVLKKKTKT